MDTELLKTFLEVSRTRHFGRAAETLYVTQSTVSFRIKQLENQLNKTLFIRHRNNITLTPAGHALVPYAQQLLTLWSEVKREIAGPQHNELIIGACPAVWETILANWSHAFCQQPRDCRLHLQMLPCGQLYKSLTDHGVDLVFSLSVPSVEDLVVKRLGEISFSLFHSSQTALQEAQQHYIRIEWDTAYHQQNEALLQFSLLMSSQSVNCILPVLHQSKGCAFLPDNWAERQTSLQRQPQWGFRSSLFAAWLADGEKVDLIGQILTQPVVDALLSHNKKYDHK